eukprot:PhM_4_TR16135/c2_g2_i3/m.5404
MEGEDKIGHLDDSLRIVVMAYTVIIIIVTDKTETIGPDTNDAINDARATTTTTTASILIIFVCCVVVVIVYFQDDVDGASGGGIKSSHLIDFSFSFENNNNKTLFVLLLQK